MTPNPLHGKLIKRKVSTYNLRGNVYVYNKNSNWKFTNKSVMISQNSYL